MTDRPPAFNPEVVADPRVLLERAAAASTAAVSPEMATAGWYASGVLGGAAFGATIGGPVGAVVGAGAGAVAATVRGTTGKSILEYWEELDAETKARLLGMVATSSASSGGRHNGTGTVGSGADSSGPATSSGPASARGGTAVGLSMQQLRELSSSPASSDEPACKVCLVNKVAVALQPCGHACTCAPCTLRLGGSGTPLCPICRTTATAVVRVFI